MQIAAFLSDLKSLSICSHEAAIALVKPPAAAAADASSGHAAAESTATANQDFQRADELVSLHYDVKLKYLENGPDPAIVRARRDVDRVLASLNEAR